MTDIQKLAANFRAVGHPIRLQIINAMANGRREWSPKKISDEIKAPLGVVSYHIRVMLDSELLTLVDTRQVRGAIEHFYRLTPKAKRVYKEFVK